MASLSLLNISIPRRSRSCARSGEKFLPGSSYISLLKEGEKGEMAREDILLSFWEEKGSQAELAEVKSFWRGKIPERKDTPLTGAETNARAEELLQEYLSSEQQVKAYLVALYLVRKKRLILRQELLQEQQKIHLYESVESEQMFAVPACEPQTEEIEALQKVLNDEIGDLS